MGYFFNRERFEQASLRKGLESLNIQSMDIDAYVDMGGKLQVFIEFKVHGTELTKSQEYAIKTLLSGDSIPTVFLVASHETSPDEEIAQKSYVTKAYWKMPGQPIKTVNYPLYIDGVKFDGDVMELDECLCTLALWCCPRLIGPNPTYYFWPDDMLRDIQLYFLSNSANWEKQEKAITEQTLRNFGIRPK